MTTQLLAVLAAAGLVSAGVAATAETRSAAAIPAVSMASSVKAAKSSLPMRSQVARQGGRPDCGLPENASLPACATPGNGVGAGGAGGGGGVSGGVLAAIAGGLGAAGIVVAAKNDSNG